MPHNATYLDKLEIAKAKAERGQKAGPCAFCLRILEANEMLRTCVSCKHKTERVLRGHRITATQSCRLGSIEYSKNGFCERYEARFEKSSVNRVVVKMEDYLL